LTNHLLKTEHISTKEYFDNFLNSQSKICICGKEKTFIGLEKGYKKYCSSKCSSGQKEVKDKRKNTVLKKYGVDSPAKEKSILDKMKRTNTIKYGCNFPLQNEKIKNKMRETNINRYGNMFSTSNPLVLQKIKKTNLEKYGFENVGSNSYIKEKIKKTNLKKYGATNPNKSKSIKEKIKKTNLEKYGEIHYTKTNEYKYKIRYKLFRALIDTNRIKNICSPLFNMDDFLKTDLSEKLQWKCEKCKNVFFDHINNGRIPRCPSCFPIASFSFVENRIFEYCKQFSDNVEKGNRDVLNGKEIDILIKDIGLGIEINGLKWHSEIFGGKNNTYHNDKRKLAQSKNYKLIQFFDDEIYDKIDIVNSIIKCKFGKAKNKIYARKTEVRLLSIEDKRKFLDENHIQGDINSKINVGLFYNEELVSVMSFGKPRYNKNYEYEILRFCNKIDTIVVGGLSKLFKFFVSTYEAKSVITYSDLRFGDGASYKMANFKFLNSSAPSYYYIDKGGNKRISRINFQKHLLKDKLNIFYPNLTEWQNMQLNGYDRVWDCGCNVYEWKI
jgi:hypothetical protein